MDNFETKDEGNLSINKVFARAFINFLNATVAVEMSEVFMVIPTEGFRFKMLNQAHMSVLSSLSLLVTDKAEAFQEFDRMQALLASKAPDSTGAHILRVGRENMEKMLAQASLLRGN